MMKPVLSLIFLIFTASCIKSPPSHPKIYEAPSGPFDPSFRQSLTYCVDRPDFKELHSEVAQKVAEAMTIWSDYGDVRFFYRPDLDDSCREETEVMIKVVGFYDKNLARARATYPSPTKGRSQLLVNLARRGELFSGTDAKGVVLPLFLHEVGHLLGFAHEQDKPSPDSQDRHSIMYYPWLKGGWGKDWDQVPGLSFLDKMGVREAYRVHPLDLTSITPWFSEEGEGLAGCPKDQVVIGIQCQGRYCDRLRLACQKIPPHASPQHSAPISDEGGILGENKALFTSLSCEGRYCDRMRGQLVPMELEACYNLPPFTDGRQNHGVCKKGDGIASIRCSGSYCDNLEVSCCKLPKWP